MLTENEPAAAERFDRFLQGRVDAEKTESEGGPDLGVESIQGRA